MSAIKDIIEKGQSIPAGVTEVDDCDDSVWVPDTEPDRWRCPGTQLRDRPSVWVSTQYGPLTVTAVRDPAPVDYGCDECSSEPGEGHVAPCSKFIRPPRQPSAPDFLAAVNKLTIERDEARAEIEQLKAMLVEIAPAQPDPLVLSLPEVDPRTVALVGRSGRRYPRQVDELSARVWWECGPNAVWGLGYLLDKDGPATGEMAPPREPRTWPKLEVISDSVKAVRGASGTVYHRSHFSQSVPVFCEHDENGTPTGSGRMFYALQTFDGPLTEVFDNEPGGAA